MISSSTAAKSSNSFKSRLFLVAPPFLTACLLYLTYSFIGFPSTTSTSTSTGSSIRTGSYPIPPSLLPPQSKLPASPNWTFASAPPVCRDIISAPKPIINCKLNKSTMRCENGSVSMFGQYAQDFYLYTNHFSKMTRRGIYVDIAANDPVFLSNTVFLDRCLGWSGLCVEPNPEYHFKLRSLRTCHLHPTCMGATEGESVNFVFNGGFSGVKEGLKFSPEKRTDGSIRGETTLNCTTLASTLAEREITHVDLLSLDVEGHEMNVLQGIDWTKVRFDVMVVEVAPSTEKTVQQFLEAKGYVRHIPQFNKKSIDTGLLVEDAIFLRRGVEFGQPR